MNEIDNRKGTETIYFISDVAPFYGRVNVGQVSTSTYQFVTYVSESEWLSDLKLLGIEINE